MATRQGAAVDKWPAAARLWTVATAGHLPTAVIHHDWGHGLEEFTILIEELVIKARAGGVTVEEIAVLNSILDALNKKVRAIPSLQPPNGKHTR